MVNLYLKIGDLTFGISALATLHANLRGSEEYNNEQETILDTTMSCNRLEATEWMKHYMTEAIIRENKSMFLAAYDIFTELQKAEVAI